MSDVREMTEMAKRSNLSEIWFCYLVKYGKNEIACFQNKGIQRFRVCL